MKVVYIQPKAFFSWEALGLGYIGAYCKHHGFTDQEFFSSSWDDEEFIVERAAAADVVAFSCTSPQMKNALHLARRIKGRNPKVWTVFGGVHTSALPEETVLLPEVDSVVVGEGEASMLKILQGCREPIVKSPYIEDPDTIPYPDRELIKVQRHMAKTYEKEGRRVTSIFSSRACPFRCVFCASNSVWGRKMRFRSPENIVGEFEQLQHDWNVDYISFADDEIGLKRAHLKELCELLIGNNNKIKWGGNVVVSTVSEELLKMMKMAGCTDLWMGVESGSPRILKAMGKPFDIEDVKWAFNVAKKYGFSRRAYIILGMPDETLEDIELTDQLIEEIDPDVVGFTILAPFPGTRFYDHVKHKDVDWSQVDEYTNDLTETKTVTNRDLKEIQKKLVQKYKHKIAYHHKLYEGW
jgi:radical SAM superfamily enzyme YgiQ (UPF0313 family)